MENCHDKLFNKVNKVAVSNKWCPAPLLGAAAIPAHSFELYWTVPGNFQNTVIHKLGITLTLEPWGNHEFVPGNNLQRYPNPTACRKSEDGTRRNYISNTYIMGYTNRVGVALTTRSQKTVRHGVLGYEAVDNAVRDDLVALATAAGGVAAPIVSLNLLSNCARDSHSDDLITNQNTVFANAQTANPNLHYANYNWGVNLAARMFGHNMFQGRTNGYAKWNVDPNVKMTQMVLREVAAQLSAPYAVGGDDTSQAFARPAQCTRPARGSPGTPWHDNWADLVFRNNQNTGAELLRIANLLGPATINNHKRLAARCALKQAKAILNLASVGNNAAEAMFPGMIKNDGTHALGNTAARQRQNTILAIDILLKLIRTTGSWDERHGDIVRTFAASTFLGFNGYVNCKSGIDRTGIMAPAMAAFSMMAYSMEDQEGTDTLHNKLPRDCLPTLAEMAIRYSKVIARAGPVNDWQAQHSVVTAAEANYIPPAPLVCPQLAAGATDAAFMHADGARLIAMFQALTFEIAMKTSMKITYASTGVIGIKWSKPALEDQGTAETVVKFFVPNGLGAILTAGDFMSASGKRAS